MSINVVIRTSVGWEEQICSACGNRRTEYVEMFLRHSGQKIILRTGCDEAQLGKPRMVMTTSAR